MYAHSNQELVVDTQIISESQWHANVINKSNTLCACTYLSLLE